MFTLLLCEKHGSAKRSISTEKNNLIEKKGGDGTQEKEHTKTKKVLNREGRRRKKQRIRFKARNVQKMKTNKDKRMGEKKVYDRPKKKGHEFRQQISGQEKKSEENNTAVECVTCSSKYKEYGLLALAKAATLVKQVVSV